MNLVAQVQEWSVYQLAMDGAIQVFRVVQQFPPVARNEMGQPMVGSTRGICLRLVEAWFRRWQVEGFGARLSGVAAEASKVQVWVELAIAHGYLTAKRGEELYGLYGELAAEVMRLRQRAVGWAVPLDELNGGEGDESAE